MAVPYHTHTFEIPAATKEDVIAGVATDKAVTPSSLGSCAVQNVEDFATADQGKKADTAIQPEDLAKVATTGDYADLENRPALGSAATMDASAFATALQGAKADTAVQPHDIKSAAYHDAGDFSVWNWIINGDFSINQRQSAVRVPPQGVYGYDRWMGGPNNRAWQTCERVPVGMYTLLWTGDGICSVGNNASDKPILADFSVLGDGTISADANVTNVMLLRGDWTKVDPVEAWAMCARSPQQELALCQRYYCAVGAYAAFNAPDAGYYTVTPIYWPQTMRVTPTVVIGGWAGKNTTQRVYSITQGGAAFEIKAIKSGESFNTDAIIYADAEFI